ncbi:MAG: hypothetical protein QOD82_6165 [Pseudonocardiales bacterium]|nr:hypothetical protein [Pseudonocardiales bacterium]
MRRSEGVAASWPRLTGGVGSAIGFGAAIVATLLGWCLGAGDRPAVGLVLLAAVAVGVGATTTLPGALAAAAQCWGMYSGFELHRFGELRLDASSRSALVLLLTVGVAASLLGLAATGQASRAGRSPAGRPVERGGVGMVISHTGSRHRKCSLAPRRAEPRPAGPIRPSPRPDRSGWPVG